MMRFCLRAPGFARPVRALCGLFALVLVAVPSWVAAQPTIFNDGAWSQLPIPNRRGAALVLDATRNRIIVFGGEALSLNAQFNDAWALSLSDGTGWTPLAATGTPPPARAYSAAVYDPAGDRLIMVGGLRRPPGGGPAVTMTDVWALSLGSSPAWTLLTPAGLMSKRFGAAAIYDPVDQRMIVTGGGTSTATYNDVWSLALSGPLAWTKLTPAGTAPSGRAYLSGVYDAPRSRMVIFGGRRLTDNLCYNESWELTLGATPTWTLLEPVGDLPDPRSHHSAICDPAGQRMIAFGGSTQVSSSLDDAWSFALDGAPGWTELFLENAPPGRFGHGAAYDPTGPRMVVTGGSLYSDLWSLPLGTSVWNSLVPPRPSPNGRFGHSAIYDPVAGRMLIFGGNSFGSYSQNVSALDLGEFPSWLSNVIVGTRPSGREGHGAIYDPIRRRMLVFGGYDGTFRNDLWAANLAVQTWQPLAPSGGPPAARTGIMAVYDPPRDRMLVFGGWDGSQFRNDLWELSLAGSPSWTLLAAAGPPSGRSTGCMIYDPLRDRLVLFGGFNASQLNDLWALPLDAGSLAWAPLSPSGGPPSQRASAKAIYDAARDRLVLHGGSSAGTALGDVWGLSLSDLVWTQLAPFGQPPFAAEAHSAIYDPVRDRMVIFSGQPVFADEAWALGWGAPALPETECPGDVIWTTNDVETVDYHVTNRSPIDQTYDYVLTDSRAWPEFPMAGSVVVPAFSTGTFQAAIAVPDSAEPGLNMMVFRAALRQVPTPDAVCSHNLHDITTAVELALVNQVVTPGRVRLTWSAPASPGMTAALYRSEAGRAWEARAQLLADGSGMLDYEDAGVVAGGRYGYRLGVGSGAGEEYYGEVWVNVPARFALGLSGAWPNPAFGPLRVGFTLPDDGAATLEVVDVAGRRVWSRAVGGRGAGAHEVEVEETRRLPAGIYLVRLVRGREAMTTRVCLLR